MIALSGKLIYRSAAMVRLPPSLLMRADTNSPMTKNLGITLIRSPVTTFGNARYANSSAAYTTPYPIEDLYFRSYRFKSIPDKNIPFTREGSANVLVVQQNNAIIIWVQVLRDFPSSPAVGSSNTTTGFSEK